MEQHKWRVSRVGNSNLQTALNTFDKDGYEVTHILASGEISVKGITETAFTVVGRSKTSIPPPID